jgi:hypothetical protein
VPAGGSAKALEVTMKPIAIFAGTAAAVACLAVGVAASEGYVSQQLPERLVAAIERRDRTMAARFPRRGEEGVEFVIQKDRTWIPGSTVLVAFNGGSPELRDKIVAAANLWTEQANLTLSFRDGATYRNWSPTDERFAAQIRVGFAEAGYWSLVGIDSFDPLIVGPGEASLNLSGFDSRLPSDWRAVVIHEFGHALGFHHEHQSPNGGCQTEFRWLDDPGYRPTRGSRGEFVADQQGRRPGLYTELGGYPNFWSKRKVDFNLAELPDTDAYVTSDFDASSIMKYFFEPGMFVHGRDSRCYSPENLELSKGDKAGAAAAYPKDPGRVDSARKQRAAMLQALLKYPALTEMERDHYDALLRAANVR